VGQFIGQVVKCSVTLADGSINEANPFTIPETAASADFSCTVDQESGAIGCKAEMLLTNGEGASSDDVYAPLSAELMAFDPTPITGEYTRKNCEVDRSKSDNADKIKAIKKGKLADTGLDGDCEGWEQGGVYLKGELGITGSASPLVQDVPPTVSMWNRKTDHDACYVGGSLKMDVSDGSNSIDFGNGSGIAVASLFSKVKEYGWAPAVALARSEAANPEDAPADPKSAEIRAKLEAVYSDPCGGFAADLAKAWAMPEVGVIKKGGRTICDKNLVYATPVAELNEMLNREIQSGDGGGMIEECGMYKKAKTEKSRKQAVDKFVSMCRSFIAGKPGEHEEMRAQLELVDAFVRSIGELKWQTGDSRFDGLKRAMKGLDLDAPSAISSANLESLGREWMLVSWDWRARRILEFAIESMDSAISGADEWLNVNGQTGRAAIIAMLSDTNTRNNLDELVCSDQWQMPSLVRMVGESSTTAIEAKLSSPSQSNNFQSTWNDNALTTSDKKTLLLAFINAYLAKEIEHCERVKLNSQKTQITNFTDGQNNGGWSPVDGFPQYMLGHQLMEAKQRKVMEEIGALLANGTYAQLYAKMQELGQFRMGGDDWMARELERRQEEGADEAGMLYHLKQMLGGEAARSAFRYDNTYLAKMRQIKEASTCLPDANINWQGEIDADGNEVFNVRVNGPVKQVFKAPLALNGDYVRAVDTRLESGGECYWGNVNGFSAIPKTAFSNTDGFVSPYMMAWFNGCGGGNSSSEDSLQGMFTVTKLSPVTNE
jgi:hypothetical protein